MEGADKKKMHSNINRFLTCTTPSVRGRSPADKPVYYQWQSDGKDRVVDFILEDLWDNYYEWSACGTGVPILLNNGETVVQYYVPYLSAIQIFTSKFHANLRINNEDSETDSWSDDSESEKFSRSWDAISDDSAFDQDAAWPMKDRLGHLYLQYMEASPPFARIPLMDKINALAFDYPGLASFKSTELSPASWMSVAWYPIYHIPSKRNVKDLSASFLTYHTISSLFQENISGKMEKDLCCTSVRKNRRKVDESCCTFLSPFGLSTYKMQGNLWLNPEADDYERLNTLYSAADSWLKQLRFRHHDFHYFSTHSV